MENLANFLPSSISQTKGAQNSLGGERKAEKKTLGQQFIIKREQQQRQPSQKQLKRQTESAEKMCQNRQLQFASFNHPRILTHPKMIYHLTLLDDLFTFIYIFFGLFLFN